MIVHRKKTEDELILGAKKGLEKKKSLQLPSSRSLQGFRMMKPLKFRFLLEIDQVKHFSNSEVESSPLDLHVSQMKSISRSSNYIYHSHKKHANL